VNYLETATTAARAGASVLMEHFRNLDFSDVKTKERSDFVSHVDNRSEQAIRRIILEEYPDHLFVGEEQGAFGVPGEWRWIVDPLDGTSNYVHGVAQFSVSVALLQGDDVVASVVFDPMKEEMYRAERGSGAFRNDTRIHVSDLPLRDALIGTGFPFKGISQLDDYLATFHEVFSSCAGVRRMGSAALDLAYVASGEYGGFWEFILSPWDIAGGALLIKEAGGVITDFAGDAGYLDNGRVIAGGPAVHQELLGIVQTVLSETGAFVQGIDGDGSA
jgi:myo-inositol-1(or 4)-monophosphatase